MVQQVFSRKPILTTLVQKAYKSWIEKHNRYSTDEAKETLYQLKHHKVNWRNLLFGSTEVERRRALKDLSLRLPFRPLLRWFYMYFLLGGCLDGKAGFAWCTLQAFYEYLILLKVWELKHSKNSEFTREKLTTDAETKEVRERGNNFRSNLAKPTIN